MQKHLALNLLTGRLCSTEELTPLFLKIICNADNAIVIESDDDEVNTHTTSTVLRP